MVLRYRAALPTSFFKEVFMPWFYARFQPLALSALVLFSANAYAAAEQTFKPANSWVAIDSEVMRREAVVKRTNTLFTLLGGEMALQKGDASVALATYMVMLDRHKTPEIAERAMEMAISLHAYVQAEAIYKRWREIEPIPSDAQRRMAWMRSVIAGDVDGTFNNLKEVLSKANEIEARRIFLLLTQMSVQHPQLAEQGAGKVHAAMRDYKDMPEAMIADAVFSAQINNQKNAVAALQQLAKLDSDIRPATQLALRLISQRQPEVLVRFFAETDTKNLSPLWQELQVDSLIHAERLEEASSRLEALLAENPSADLFIQAALLAASRKAELTQINNYLDKAYMTGTQEQQSKAAVIATINNVQSREYTQAKSWINRINAPEYAFDKIVLNASLEAEQSRWQAALNQAKKAHELPEQQGRFYSNNDLLRVQLFAISRLPNAQQSVTELNALYNQVSKQKDADEKLADILYQRGLVYVDRLQQWDKGIADLQRYLAISPNSAQGLNALGYTMLIAPNADIGKAFGLIQAAYQAEPESAAINDSMGWAYYLKDDAEAALPYLQYAWEKLPDPEVGAHLGEVLWKLGKNEDAQVVLQKAYAENPKHTGLNTTIKRTGISVTPIKAVKKHR